MRLVAAALLLCLAFDASALPRDKTEIRKFRKMNPCPATGMIKGRCPGYEIDHVTPLKCRGRDRPENMQWITVEAHKVKSRGEAGRCRGTRKP